MNKQFGMFKKEKKFSPDISFFMQNVSILFDSNSTESIKTTEPISLPFTKDVTYTAELTMDVGNKDNFYVYIRFRNGSEEQKRFTCNLQLLNCIAADNLLSSSITSKTLIAKETQSSSFHLAKSSILKSGDDCNIVIRVEEVWTTKKFFKCEVADGPCMPDLSVMYQDENFKDIKFLIGEESLMAHKNVLATRSTVFHSMFIHDTKEKQDGVVTIEDFSMIAFDKFIKYLYTNETEDLDELAEELLMIADKYDVQCLRRKCEIHLCRQMQEDEAIHFLILGDKFNLTALKQRALFLIASNPKIPKSADFNELIQYPHLKDDIIKLLFNDHELVTDFVQVALDANNSKLTSTQ